MMFVQRRQSTRKSQSRLFPLLPVSSITPQERQQARAAQAIQRLITRPVGAQNQVVQAPLRAAALERQEVQRVHTERQEAQRQLTSLAVTPGEVEVPPTVPAPNHLPVQLPVRPANASDWVTVMRVRAQEVEGQSLDSRAYADFKALQRQVAQSLAQGFRQDRGPAQARAYTYGEHLAALHGHPISAPVARVVLGLVPAAERPTLQRAVDTALQRTAEQQTQEARRLHAATLQRQLAELDVEAAQPVLSRIQARRGAGNPLPEAVQRHLEQGLNHDLSRVRIHDDAEADTLAKGVGAIAFTTGTDIFFQSGTFNPNTRSGLELLAHEVTHTVQQGQGRVGPGVDPDAGLEVEARQMGAKLAQVMPSPKSLMPPSPYAPGLYTAQAALHRAKEGAVTATLHQPFAALGIQRQAQVGMTIQRNVILNKVSDLAANIPGYRELCLAFGKDLVTGKRLDQNPDAILDALAGLVPGPFKDMLKVVRDQKLIPKAWAWFKGELGKLQLGGALSEVMGAVKKFPPDLSAAKAALTRRADGLKRLIAGSARHIAQIALTALEAGLGPVGKKVMGLLKQGGDVIVQVLRDPAKFARNLLAALTQGFGQFRTNAGKWLKEGLGSWLTGASGIQFPTTLDLKGVFMTALSVMGLTYQALRGRLVKELGQGGEQKVAAAEKAGGALASLTKGLHQAPEIKGQQSNVGQGVVDSLKGEVTRSLVTAGAAKVASMLVPGGAFVQALLTAFSGVQTLISQGSRIMGVILNALGSVRSIAAGQIGAAAGFIERTIGGSIPIVLTFLGNVLRIGNLGTRIRGSVMRIRTRLDASIQQLIGRIKKMAGQSPGRPTPTTGSSTPNASSTDDKRKRVTLAIDQAMKQAEKPGMTFSRLNTALEPIRKQHGLKILKLIPQGVDRYVIFGKVNPDDTSKPFNLKGAKYNLVASIAQANRNPRVFLRQQQEAEQLLINLRSVQLGKTSEITAKDILSKGNLALGFIYLAGRTAKGAEVRHSFRLTRDDALTVFSSGKGLVTREQMRLPIVDIHGNELRAGSPLPAPIQSLVPKVILDAKPEIMVADTPALTEFVNKKLAPAVNAKGYNASLHKHSEQVLWQFLRLRQAQIMGVARSLGLAQITAFHVDIHSEREMCGMCSASSNFILQHMQTELPGLHAMFAKSTRDSGRAPNLRTNVTSSQSFGGRAPAAGSGAPNTTYAFPATGRTQVRHLDDLSEED